MSNCSLFLNGAFRVCLTPGITEVLCCRAGRAAQQVRHGSSAQQSFHAKYGLGVMVSGTVFCTAVWGYVLTQTGIAWNLSPVGKVMPKEWRQAEE
ncbi:Cytochrome c oxidase subunit 7B, mitochondrial [Oryzias melastigma]|uniref:Cytochrome c oxidase subunit 7B, mitochondrial n=1 Tax=Oryzias melastigma TaxID=30732 RepID=A0A834C9B4_ORYME|nr:Cytochrome c oxidase subunit 7B, mitochondrial [Oryzias melastigma]KAF6738198.1 Cytochrome c oxidase subunit 7B, mitochondrial [Oryzias melastigma]